MQNVLMVKPSCTLTLALMSLAFASVAQTPSGSASSAQKIVIRYFQEVLDQGRVEVLQDLLLPSCAIHRPEGELKGLAALQSMVAGRRANFSAFKTQVHDLIESGDRVVVRLKHEGTGSGPMM